MSRVFSTRHVQGSRVATSLVIAGLLLYVLLVYVVVVLGGAAAIGSTTSPDLVLSVAATAIVALSFGRVQAWLEVRVSRVTRGGQPAPHDVLRRFSDAVGSSIPAEELPSQIARVLAEGVGAASAEVWLFVDGQLTLAATWPERSPGSRAPAADETARRSREVRQAGELLGVLIVREPADVVLSAVEERLFTGLADQAGLVLRGARLRAELARRAAELSSSAQELRESRERVVDAHDAERRRLERDIHDGAQQHLVALAVNLRLAHTLLPRSPERAMQFLAEQDRAIAEAVETLTDLSRGIYPSALREAGLVPAIEVAKAASPIPVRLVAEGVPRFTPAVESAAYFCALEALQNAAKHSAASVIDVTVTASPDSLSLTVRDDGVGLDVTETGGGTGLANIRDRVEALGGELSASGAPGGTVISVRIPAVPHAGEHLPTKPMA